MFNRPRVDVPLSAPRAAHMFASFASSHTELTSVLGTQVGLHHPKVRGTAKASTRVGNDCVCSFWKSSEMPPSDQDSSVESVKTCPKTSESEVCRSSDLRGDPLDAMSVEGEGPPSILTRRTRPTSLEQSRVCARQVLRSVRRRQSFGVPNQGTWCRCSQVVGEALTHSRGSLLTN